MVAKRGRVVGTVQYMSPEQAGGRKVDFRSDQFSLSLILYEMATGKLAFPRESSAQTMAAIIEDEPEPIAQCNPNLPTELTTIVERCLRKDPRERYQSTGDLALELKNVPETSAAPGSRRSFLWMAAGLVAVFVAVAL